MGDRVSSKTVLTSLSGGGLVSASTDFIAGLELLTDQERGSLSLEKCLRSQPELPCGETCLCGGPPYFYVQHKPFHVSRLGFFVQNAAKIQLFCHIEPFRLSPFFLKLIRPFYSVEKRSSLQQLREDFGNFPPAPLRCENLTGDFDVVRVRNLGEVFYDQAIKWRMIDTDFQSLSDDLIARFGAEKLRDLQTTFDGVSPRVFRWIKWIVIGRSFFASLAKAIRHGPSNPDSQGFFVPFFKDELQVVVKSGRNDSMGEAAVISHEHIHLLQHRNQDRRKLHVRSPKELLSEEGWTDPFLLYVLEKSEIEARLHESVLSFYRTHHYLPTMASEFQGLLASSQQFGWLVVELFESVGVNFQPGLENYPARSTRPIEHLEWVLLEIKTPELQRRFIAEVLPVMYGNLLKFYGDDKASQNFLSDIARPNFYDELYTEQITKSSFDPCSASA